MPKMHQILAVEKTLEGARQKLLSETNDKFVKPATYFQGHTKRLNMLIDNPSNKAEEEAAAENKAVHTTVLKTLEYALGPWLQAEKNQFLKNIGNQLSKADIMFRGTVLLKEVPIDQIMGLENRITQLRATLALMPTLDASKFWDPDQFAGYGYWKERHAEIKTKTAQRIETKVVVPATAQHPAQTKDAPIIENVGKTTVQGFSSAVTAQQKADVLTICDELITEIKKARVVANDQEVPVRDDLKIVLDLMLGPLRQVNKV